MDPDLHMLGEVALVGGREGAHLARERFHTGMGPEVFEVDLLCGRETTTALEGSSSGVNTDVGRQVAPL